MRAVFTYWSTQKDEKKVNQGFASSEDMARTVALSVAKIKEQPGIDEVVLVTNSFGQRMLVDRYRIPFDGVQVILDHLADLDFNLWAYAKICAFANQDRPFIHIDLDVVIFEELPAEIFTAPLSFQNRELLAHHQGYQFYLKQTSEAGVVPEEILNHPPLWAFNCGIVAANNLEIVRSWKKLVDQFLFAEAHQDYWNRPGLDKHSHNHLFEQYFISAIIQRLGIQDEIGLLIHNFENIDWQNPPFRMVHLWGNAKESQTYMAAVRTILEREFPHLAHGINQGAKEHQGAFEEIYENGRWGVGSGGGSRKEVVGEYVDFLQQFLKANKIKSVVDFGAGYWEFNDLIDWKGVKYHGLDVVEKVVKYNQENHGTRTRKFSTIKGKASEIPPCDLVLIKDVFIHWPNHEIQAFFESLPKCKFILITNDRETSGTPYNQDIEKPGEFHPVKLALAPFNLKTETVLEWKAQNKITELLTLNHGVN